MAYYYLQCRFLKGKFRWINKLLLRVQINEFVKLGGDQLVPYYADILGVVLPSISDKEEKIQVVTMFLAMDSSRMFLVGMILSCLSFGS